MHSDGIIAVDPVLNFATYHKEVWLKIKNESCFLSADEAYALADAVDSRQAASFCAAPWLKSSIRAERNPARPDSPRCSRSISRVFMRRICGVPMLRE
jgi:hypothetical protein